MRWIDSGWPLPFGSLRSARSLLGLGNFCDLLNLCVTHPSAGNQLFVAADAQSIVQHIKKGEGTVGALVMDEAIYDDVQEMVRDLKHNPWKFLWRE